MSARAMYRATCRRLGLPMVAQDELARLKRSTEPLTIERIRTIATASKAAEAELRANGVVLEQVIRRIEAAS